LKVDKSLAAAAVEATATREGSETTYNERAARSLLRNELDAVDRIPPDSPDVKQLVSEGYDLFYSRRALAFAEGNIEDARAILLADKMDEEEAEQAKQEAPLKTVEVKSDFDPSKIAEQPSSGPDAPPKPARKSDVVFEVTSSQLQQIVLESPVPVLLDVYADWCGPCKALGPALEEMAVKAGGVFRLVKVNSDNERPISAALEVTALPTVFGIRDGKILNMFQGMPRDQEALQNFMMGLLVAGAEFKPPLTETEKKKYAELTSKMIKMAGAACFPFSARERLQERISMRLDELTEQTGDFAQAEESIQVLRSLFSNVIRDPSATKFRSVKLDNKVIASKVAKYPACLAILKNVGFSGDSNTLTLGKGKKIVNVAPLTVARDCIDSWLDKSRYEVAAAARRRRDEEARKRLREEAANKKDEEVEDVESKVEVDPNACTLMLRMEGKKKIHEFALRADDPLEVVLKKIPVPIKPDDEVQITCVAKRLVIKSTDENRMKSSLRDLGLTPAASIVVNVGGKAAADTSKAGTSPKLAQRATRRKKKKKGSHTMQSVGIYAKDDNAKGELIDGGGGVLYEHDVTSDDEGEKEEEKGASDEASHADEDEVDEYDEDEG
jgi:thiol-disulfide isomerase/thioredoxin